METTSKEAVSETTIAIIFFAVVGLIAFVVLGSSFLTCGNGGYCSGTNVKTIILGQSSFEHSSEMFNFTLNNPGSTTTITNIKIDLSNCASNFSPVTGGYVGSFSCVAYGAAISRGESLNYFIDFANGESISGNLLAQ